jgi:hypothetical protein
MNVKEYQFSWVGLSLPMKMKILVFICEKEKEGKNCRENLYGVFFEDVDKFHRRQVQYYVI